MIRLFALRNLMDSQPSGIVNRRKLHPSSIDLAIQCEKLPDPPPTGILAQIAERAGQNSD